MDATEVCFLSIAEASDLIRTKRLSPIEIITAHLDQIAKTEANLNSFITVLETESLATARALENEIQNGVYRGPLHGIPIGLKDLYYTKGVRTTAGSNIMRNFVPDFDATVVKKLRSSGAIIIGKLQMHEFACGATSENPHFGPARNPWDRERITGGSSGGSGSSVASGQCMGAIGSDSGGSVRIPSSLCGIVGLKPTFGRISRTGVFPLSRSLDTVGPMTRSVLDAALILNVLAGHDPKDSCSSTNPPQDFTETLTGDVSGLRIGLPKNFFFEGIDPEIHATVLNAARTLEDAGANVREIALPMVEKSRTIARGIMGPESAEIHLENLDQHANEIDPVVRSRLQDGLKVSAVDYIRAQNTRRIYTEQMSRATESVDVLLSATTAVAATRIGEKEVKIDKSSWSPLLLLPDKTRPFNLSGVPAISLPCGFTSDGLPIGLQLSGKAFEEATVLRVAYAFEQISGLTKLRPPL